MSMNLFKTGGSLYALFLLTTATNTVAGAADPVYNDKSGGMAVTKSSHFSKPDTLVFNQPAEKTMSTPVITLQPAVENFVNDYLKKNNEMLEHIRQKSPSCFNTIDKIFGKKELPVELKYLAVIESKLKNSATSKAGAAGLWQFMPATARTLGLKIAGKTDERRYTYKSTVAAARYLSDLYVLFDDWLLVIAAYNSGPGPVYNAIKKSGSRDFWKLQHFLPRETRLHVKKFIATHYYFEGQGSLVTLTKTETGKYLKTVEEFLAAQKVKNKSGSSPGSIHQYFNWVAITHNEDNRLKVVARK
jgi:membrane-bound lytic murein transglycosylase D